MSEKVLILKNAQYFFEEGALFHDVGRGYESLRNFPRLALLFWQFLYLKPILSTVSVPRAELKQ